MLLSSLLSSTASLTEEKHQWAAECETRNHSYRLLQFLALCSGFGLRLVLLDQFPLREDEAIYSYWALHLWNVDPWALTVWPDKPPLFLWLLGGVLQLFGLWDGVAGPVLNSDAPARLLNVTADSLTTAVVGSIAYNLWGYRAGLLALIFYALSPFAISFAPTVYTDPLLVMWGMLAFLFAVKNRLFWAGLFLASAVMTKQQGIFYMPLVVLIQNRYLWRRDTGTALRSPLALTLGFLLLALPILWWDSRRWHVAPSPWDLSMLNYSELALLPASQWLARLVDWGPISWHLIAKGPLWILIFATAALAWHGGKLQWRVESGERFGASRNSPLMFPTQYFLLICALIFLAAHIVTSVQIWDRYLLPLVPLLALLCGYFCSRILQSLPTSRNIPVVFAGAVLVLLLMPAAEIGARGGYPLGGDHGDYVGLRRALTWVVVHAPADAILYHRVLGWQYRFYLFDANRPQTESSQLELRWFPHAVYLADNAAKTLQQRKFLIQPDWAPVRNAENHLAARNLDWRKRYRVGKFTVYELSSSDQ